MVAMASKKVKNSKFTQCHVLGLPMPPQRQPKAVCGTFWSQNPDKNYMYFTAKAMYLLQIMRLVLFIYLAISELPKSLLYKEDNESQDICYSQK